MLKQTFSTLDQTRLVVLRIDFPHEFFSPTLRTFSENCVLAKNIKKKKFVQYQY